MNLNSAILAIFPPVFAVILERYNPINEISIRPKVERDLKRFEDYEHHGTLLDVSTKMVTGAVEVAGLAPTILAVLTSGFGVLYEFLPNPWPILAYAFFIAVLVILVLSFLGSQTFYELEATKQPWKLLPGRASKPKRTGSQKISLLIVVVNCLLITLVVVTYCALEKPWQEFTKGEHHGTPQQAPAAPNATAEPKAPGEPKH
jgi:hypothetical protein